MRKFFMLAAAVLAAVPSAAAVAAGSGDSRQPGGGLSAAELQAQEAASFPERLVNGPLTFPIPDAPGPATLAPGVEALLDGADPGRLLDLVLTLDRPADRRLESALARLGVWSRTFEHLPSAAVRLPVARLDDLRNLRGVLAVYDNKPLQYFLKDSAKANNVERAWNGLQLTGKGVTVAIIDTGVDFTHPDLAPAMKANVKMVGFGQDPLPIVAVPGLPTPTPPRATAPTWPATSAAGARPPGATTRGWPTAPTSSASGPATACRSSALSKASSGCWRTRRSTGSRSSTTPTAS